MGNVNRSDRSVKRSPRRWFTVPANEASLPVQSPRERAGLRVISSSEHRSTFTITLTLALSRGAGIGNRSGGKTCARVADRLAIQSLLLIICLTAGEVFADRITLPKPLYAEIHLRVGNANDAKVTGNLISYDDDSLTIKAGTTGRDLKWVDLTPASAFTLRSRLIDKSKALDWLDLAKFGWSLDATDQAHAAIDKALSLDPSLKKEANAITASPPGAAVAQKELIGNEGQTTAAPTSGPSTPSPRPDDHAPSKPTELYQAATPAEDDRAITDARKMARKVESDFNVKFTTIETPHFLIFTDWNPQEYPFLKTNFEDAYKAVTEQFNIPYSDNVFVGKLPVLNVRALRRLRPSDRFDWFLRQEKSIETCVATFKAVQTARAAWSCTSPGERMSNRQSCNGRTCWFMNSPMRSSPAITAMHASRDG